MKLFMTSATGHVGSAVATALLAADHTLGALARTEVRARHLHARGISPVVGDLRDPASFVDSAVSHDAILHTAYDYDANGNERPETDERAVDALLDAAAASDTVRHVVYASSLFLLAGIADDPLDEHASTGGATERARRRLAVEQRVLAATTERLTTAVVRLGVVYGANSYTMAELFDAAQRDGSVHYYGTGNDRWPLVYRDDVASLFRAVVDRRGAGVYHAADGVPMTTARIAELTSAAAGCDGRTHRVDDVIARARFGEHYDRVARDVPAVSTRTADLGWAPSVPSFEQGAGIAFREWQAFASAASQA